MLQKFEITGVHTTIDDNLRKYVQKKIGRLDRYIPRRHRSAAHLEVWLKENKNKGKKQCICDVLLHLPQETIRVSESTTNMYAAVDIVQVKLKQQIKKYKDSHTDGKMRRRLFSRVRQQSV